MILSIIQEYVKRIKHHRSTCVLEFIRNVYMGEPKFPHFDTSDLKWNKKLMVHVSLPHVLKNLRILWGTFLHVVYCINYSVYSQSSLEITMSAIYSSLVGAACRFLYEQLFSHIFLLFRFFFSKLCCISSPSVSFLHF